MPALTFGLIPGISSFPWVMILLPFIIKSNAVKYTLIFYVISLFLSIQLIFLNLSFAGLAQSIIALLNATLIVPYILDKDRSELILITKVLISYIIASIGIGVLQLNFSWARDLTGVFFGHASGFSSKGVPSLSYEPSRAGIDIVYVLLTLIHLNKYIRIKFSNFIIVVTVLFLLIFNKSISAYLLLSVYLGLVFLLRLQRRTLLVLMLFIAIIPYVFNMIISYFDIHALESIKEVLGSEYAFETILYLGGHRVTGLISSYSSISLFGYGFGNWDSIVYQYLVDNYAIVKNIPFYRQVGLRPSPPLNFFGRFMLEIGFIGLCVYLVILFKKLISWRSLWNVSLKPEFLTIVFSLGFLSYGSNPIPFLCLSIMLLTYKLNLSKCTKKTILNQ